MPLRLALVPLLLGATLLAAAPPASAGTVVVCEPIEVPYCRSAIACLPGERLWVRPLDIVHAGWAYSDNVLEGTITCGGATATCRYVLETSIEWETGVYAATSGWRGGCTEAFALQPGLGHCTLKAGYDSWAPACGATLDGHGDDVLCAYLGIGWLHCEVPEACLYVEARGVDTGTCVLPDVHAPGEKPAYCPRGEGVYVLVRGDQFGMSCGGVELVPSS